MANFAFRAKQGPGYTLDWNGDTIALTALEASRRAINDVVEEGARIARSHPTWDNRTGQTESAVYTKSAEIEVEPRGVYVRGLHVWGEWGVEDRIRTEHATFRPSPKYKQQFERTYGSRIKPEARLLTTVDVALFLEFGTVKMRKRPWLYPAWDATKHALPELVKRYYQAISATGTPTALRNSLGRFISPGKP